jgi:tetratricopeptide (TPR) repeat protein
VPIAYVDIGNCYKIQGIDAKASEYYKKAIPLFDEASAASDSGQLIYNQANKGLAGIYIQLEDSGRAIGYLNRLVEFEDITVFEMLELGAYWMSLAEIHEKQEKWEDAVSAYHQALDYFTKAGGPLPNISRTHAKLTACYRKLHDWEAAIKELQKQIDIGEKYLKDHPNVSESRRKLIAHGIQTAHMEIKKMRKMQGSYILPVTVGVGIVIAIGILSLLLMKKKK